MRRKESRKTCFAVLGGIGLLFTIAGMTVDDEAPADIDQSKMSNTGWMGLGCLIAGGVGQFIFRKED